MDIVFLEGRIPSIDTCEETRIKQGKILKRAMIL